MNSTDSIRLIIADDHHLVRKGLAGFVRGFKRVGEVREAENGKDLLNQLRERPADVVLLDLQMPLIDGTTAAEQILNTYQDTKVLVLSAFEEDSIILKLLGIGIHGYLLKDIYPKELEHAIYSVYDKDFYHNELVTTALRKGVKRKSSRNTRIGDDISEREMEVLKLICQQFSSKEIGDKLHISEKTVHSHRVSLFEKTKSKNNVGLVLYALEHGLIVRKE